MLRPSRLAPVVLAVVAAILPAFLTGALAVQMKRDLHFDDAGLGLAVAIYFGTASVTSAAMGRGVERVGATRSLRITSVAAAAVSAGLASTGSFTSLAVWLAAAGVVNSMAQPAANLLLARFVSSAQQGLAFGIKQSAMPAATLLGGLAVPAFAVTVGWRWAFVASAGTALSAAVATALLPSGSAEGVATAERRLPRANGSDASLSALVVLAAGVGFGAAAAGALATFLVSAGVESGLDPRVAGLTLVGGSSVGITVRLLMGARADRRDGGHLRSVAWLMSGGAAGFVLLALDRPGAIVLATPIAFGLGWSWPGLFNFAVVRWSPSSPGSATGITQTGTYIGALAGPLAFGAISQASSYSVAWLIAASWFLLAAAAVLAGRSMLRRPRSPVASEVLPLR